MSVMITVLEGGVCFALTGDLLRWVLDPSHTPEEALRAAVEPPPREKLIVVASPTSEPSIQSLPPPENSLRAMFSPPG
jgi:hypothetical protein